MNLDPHRPDYRQSASAVPETRARTGYGVVGVIVRQHQLLLIRRSRFVTAPGLVCFAGGGVEAGETEPQALVREMREELGIEIQAERRLWQNVTRWGTALGWWLIVVDHSLQLSPDPREVEECFWLTLDEIASRDDLLGSMPDFLAACAAGKFELPASVAPINPDARN